MSLQIRVYPNGLGSRSKNPNAFRFDRAMGLEGLRGHEEIGREIFGRVCTIQSLKRLKGVTQVYSFPEPGVPSRYSHSRGVARLAALGAYHVGYDYWLAAIGGLLHDVGQGPFAHPFENFVNRDLGIVFKHEEFGPIVLRDIEGLCLPWAVLDAVKRHSNGIVSMESAVIPKIKLSSSDNLK